METLQQFSNGTLAPDKLSKKYFRLNEPECTRHLSFFQLRRIIMICGLRLPHKVTRAEINEMLVRWRENKLTDADFPPGSVIIIACC